MLDEPRTIQIRNSTRRVKVPPSASGIHIFQCCFPVKVSQPPWRSTTPGQGIRRNARRVNWTASVRSAVAGSSDIRRPQQLLQGGIEFRNSRIYNPTRRLDGPGFADLVHMADAEFGSDPLKFTNPPSMTRITLARRLRLVFPAWMMVSVQTRQRPETDGIPTIAQRKRCDPVTPTPPAAFYDQQSPLRQRALTPLTPIAPASLLFLIQSGPTLYPLAKERLRFACPGVC